MKNQESFQNIFVECANQIHSCKVENVIVEEKRRLFRKETVFHHETIGAKKIRFNLLANRVYVGDACLAEGGQDHWDVLFDYDEYHVNEEDGIVDFFKNEPLECVASFFLEDMDLHIFTEKGWVSYQIESSEGI